MNSVIVWTLSDRFAFFIQQLTRAIGNACTPRTPRADYAVLALFHQRTLHYLRRFKRFAEAADPAALNPKPRRRRAPDPDQPEPPQPRKPRLMLPRQLGWLRKLAPEQIAVTGVAAAAGMLLQLLQDPELEALLATCPTLARSLRPLCHAIGIRTLYGRPLPFPPKQHRKPGTASRSRPTTPAPAPQRTSQPAAPPFAFPPARQKTAV